MTDLFRPHGPETYELVDNAHFVLLAAADAAVSWWKKRKPRGWGIERHLANPIVNCTQDGDARLGRAAAKWYAIQHPEATPPKNSV